MKSAHKQENEEEKKLCIEALEVNDEIIVEDKPIFEEWFLDDEVDREKITVSGNSKAYTGNLIKETDIVPKYKYSPK